MSPLFGNTELWDFNRVVERPVNRPAWDWRISLSGLSPELNLLVREMAMIWFNPRHPAVLRHGLHLRPTPRSVGVVHTRIGFLRALVEFGARTSLPETFCDWSDEDVKNYTAWRKERLQKNTSTEPITVINDLYQFSPLLARGGLSSDPWPGITPRRVLDVVDSTILSTPAIPPQTWFPLVRAAWTYIEVFGADILASMDRWQHLRAAAGKVDVKEAEQLLTAWLADPANRVPVRPGPTDSEDSVNWSLLTWMMGALNTGGRSSNLFVASCRTGRARRRLVLEQAVGAGRTQPGLLPQVTEVDRPDGTRGPWHPALHGHDLWIERTALRNACFIFTIALSMMRDSEIRAVVKGSVVEYFSNPAVKSTKRKGDAADLPVKHWWIIEPVAKAIDIASQLSLHDKLVFGSVNERDPEAAFESQRAIESFTKHVNRHRGHTGLAEIPKCHVTPHMFRRTMAMLTRDFPGSEIAVGMQLKHVATRALANRSTQGYMEKESSWAQELDDAISERRFRLTARNASRMRSAPGPNPTVSPWLSRSKSSLSR